MSSDHQDSDSDMSTDEDCDVSVDDLIRSAQFGRLYEVQALVEQYGVDVNGSGSASSWTALLVACFNGHTEVVEYLIESGADVNKRWDSHGFVEWSPIHFASTHGHRDVVQLLLSYGAAVDDREYQGKQAIHLACESGHEELTEFLLANGATVSDVDQNGFTPLICACLYGRNSLVVTLLSKGAGVDDRALSGTRPISVASCGGHNDVVLTLISHGADVNDFDFPRVCPLYTASRTGQHEVLVTLLAHGAQLKNRDFSHWNPLHPACAGAHYEVVRTLLDLGANTETYDEKGLTLVQNVCNGMCRSQFVPRVQMSDKAYSLKILLEYGLDPSAPDRYGLTTLQRVRKDDRAMYTFDKDVLALLLDYGVASAEACRLEECNCNETVLMCWYIFFRMLITVSPEARATTEPLIDNFEKYFIKARLIGFDLRNDEKAFEPPQEESDWNQSRREDFLEDCVAELTRMQTNTIGNTSATYFSLLIRDLSALRHQKLLGKLSSDECVLRYPIYGNMIFCSYVRLKRLFLEEESPDFFTILSPPLLPECAEVVLSYLSVRDLENVVKVFNDYQIYLEKISKFLENN